MQAVAGGELLADITVLRRRATILLGNNQGAEALLRNPMHSKQSQAQTKHMVALCENAAVARSLRCPRLGCPSRQDSDRPLARVGCISQGTGHGIARLYAYRVWMGR